jgi:hypothetical protein
VARPAARTATTSSADQTNYNAKGVLVYLNVTAASGTGGLQVQVQGKDPVSGNYYNLTSAPTAVIATTGSTPKVYAMGPSYFSTGGAVTQNTTQALPRTWRVQVVAGDASSYTYSVSASVIL